MKARDLLWLLAYPLYQIIGTFRHEGAHALVSILSGGKVTKFVFWPSIYQGHFYWGYVMLSGSSGWLVDAAPYLMDLVTFLVFFPLCFLVLFRRKWVWINLAIIGAVSPFLNSLYNYAGGGSRLNDVGRLFRALPGSLVQAYFGLTLGIYVIGIVLIVGFSKTARSWKDASRSLPE